MDRLRVYESVVDGLFGGYRCSAGKIPYGIGEFIFATFLRIVALLSIAGRPYL